MHGGFRRAIHGPTRVDEIDIEGTRELRELIRSMYVTRQNELDQPWFQLVVELCEAM
jgi:hypothetical protein